MTPKHLIEAVLEKCYQTNEPVGAYTEVVGGAIVTMHDDFVEQCLDISSLARLQAPQAFPYELILHCHQQALAEGLTHTNTDAKLVTHYGHKMHLVRGSFQNVKVTTTEDWLLVQAVVDNRELAFSSAD